MKPISHLKTQGGSHFHMAVDKGNKIEFLHKE